MASSVPAGIERAHGSADSAPGSSSAQHPGESAAAGPARWYTQLDAEAGGATGLSQDLSRYPGMTPSVSWQHSPQPETTLPPPQGRSNRNSIQYKVGAPRELITQEAGITVPGTISESDFDEDDFDDRISPGGDPMMRLNHNYGGA
ncbi:hypothetical protein H4R19_006023 [Coemansia spiralis]|nr:hypothetical protein H4R19_006023 [Coemansia spiralis]